VADGWIVDGEREDFILGVVAFDLERSCDLDEFPHDRSRCGTNHARDLHSDRRSARHNVAIAHPLPARPYERKWIDPWMPSKHAIFVRDESIQVKRRYFFERNLMPPHMILARKRSQRRAIMRHNNHGVLRVSSRHRKRETPAERL